MIGFGHLRKWLHAEAGTSLVEIAVSAALLVGLGVPVAAAGVVWLARAGTSPIHAALPLAEARLERTLALGDYADAETRVGRWHLVQRVDTVGARIEIYVAVSDRSGSHPAVVLTALRRVEPMP